MSKRNVETICPVTPQQQGMLLESVHGSTPGMFIEQVTCLLEGDVDRPAFEKAWQHILDRHAMLRTAFAWKGRKEPLQVVLKNVRLPVEVEDWRHLAPEEQEERFRTALESESREGFDLSKAPLMRFHLFRVGERAHRLLWTHHHILMDGWCQSILFREFFAFYHAFSRGTPPSLVRSRPYRDYVLWLRSKLEDLAPAESFWRDNLRGFSRPTPLGREPAEGDGAGPVEHGYVERKGRLDAATTATLRALAKDRQLTLNTLTQGLWGLLLSRYGGEDDVLFGTTVSGRPPELEGAETMVGLFINTLPLRLRIDPRKPFWAWLAGVQERHLDVRNYEYCSTGQVHQWSEMPGWEPLYLSLLTYENYPSTAEDEELAEITLDAQDAEHKGAMTTSPLAVLVNDGPALEVVVILRREHFAEGDADTVLGHLLELYRRIADGADRTLAEVRAAVGAEEAPSFRMRVPSLDAAAPYAAPRTPAETRLTDIWAEVLGLERVGVHDNFFELNGHSLLAMQLLTRIRDAFDVEIPLARLFEAPTVADLAGWIAEHEEQGRDGGAPARPSFEIPRAEADPEARHEPFPLSDVQRVYWTGRSGLFDLGEQGANLYVEIRIRGMSDFLAAGCEEALARLVERHDMLRAVLLPDGRQRVLAEVPRYEIEVTDLRGREPAAVEEALAATRDRLRFVKGEMERWPLFDFLIHRLDGDCLHLHLRLDALLADGTSRRLLIADLIQLLHGAELEPPALDFTYRDYVLARERFRDHELYRRARDYWHDRLPGLPPPPELPLARRLDAGGRRRFENRTIPVLEAEGWQALQQRTARAGLTTSALVAAAFAEVLAARARSPRFTLGLVGSYRLPVHPRVDQVAGNFNTLHLLAVEDAPGTFEERARKLHRQLTADLEHRYFSGFEVLREMRRTRGMSSSPAMPILFNSVLEYSHPAYQQGAGGAGEEPGDAPAAAPLEFTPLDTSLYPPQVLLLTVVSETPDHGLECQLKVLEEVFPEGLIEELSDAYVHLLQRLASSDEAWNEARESFPTPVEGRTAADAPATTVAPPGAGDQATAPPAGGNGFEGQVIEIWRDVLATETVGLRDSLFEAGGTSYDAALLAARIRQQFGRQVLTPDFFTNPTIEHILAVLKASEMVSVSSEGSR